MLREAIDLNALDLYYQPKVNGLTNSVVGVEALLRWKTADGEMIMPNDFIPIAESSQLIIPLGELVLKRACAQAFEWHKTIPHLHMAVNISPVQFNQDLVETVTTALKESGLKAEYLELEITESLLINDEGSINIIHELKALGVKLVMDDFGKGYSSLSYIRKFPLDVIKIDQAFVRNMLGDDVDKSIIQTIILLADNLGLELVAEGVETQVHVDTLLAMSCKIFQGYHYSRPLPVDEITQYLSASLR